MFHSSQCPKDLQAHTHSPSMTILVENLSLLKWDVVGGRVVSKFWNTTVPSSSELKENIVPSPSGSRNLDNSRNTENIKSHNIISCYHILPATHHCPDGPFSLQCQLAFSVFILPISANPPCRDPITCWPSLTNISGCSCCTAATCFCNSFYFTTSLRQGRLTTT